MADNKDNLFLPDVTPEEAVEWPTAEEREYEDRDFIGGYTYPLLGAYEYDEDGFGYGPTHY